MDVTNNGKATLVLNSKVGGSVRQISLIAGETKTFDLVKTKAVEARIKAGLLSVDGDVPADDTDRDALKAKATELKIEFPANIPTAKLKELVDAELAKSA